MTLVYFPLIESNQQGDLFIFAERREKSLFLYSCYTLWKKFALFAALTFDTWQRVNEIVCG